MPGKKKETRLVYGRQSRLETSTTGKKPFIVFIFCEIPFPERSSYGPKKGGKLFFATAAASLWTENENSSKMVFLLLPPPSLHALVNYGSSSFHLLEFLTVLHPDFP